MELKGVNDKKMWLFSTLGLTGGWIISANDKNILKTGNTIMKYYKQVKEQEENIFAYPVILEYISNNNLTEWFKKTLEHLNVEFVMDNDIRMYFYDQLSFGTLKIIGTQKELDKKLKELGPDIMDMETTFSIFKEQLFKQKGNKDKMIGNIIVNQKIISGIGNYLRADVLWVAGISPFRKLNNISDNELQLLFRAIKGLMWGDYNYKEAIRMGLIDNVDNEYDKDGKVKWQNGIVKLPRNFNRDFFVYKQDTDILGYKVIKKELFEGNQKRFIYFVDDERIQK
jgi:formamidopyrimidine-DNA glycosylase